MNPCVEFCWKRYYKEYSSKCDNECDYARVIIENKKLKQINSEKVSVVRCKDCKFRFTSKCSHLTTGNDNGFCSYGKSIK